MHLLNSDIILLPSPLIFHSSSFSHCHFTSKMMLQVFRNGNFVLYPFFANSNYNINKANVGPVCLIMLYSWRQPLAFCLSSYLHHGSSKSLNVALFLCRRCISGTLELTHPTSLKITLSAIVSIPFYLPTKFYNIKGFSEWSCGVQ